MGRLHLIYEERSHEVDASPSGIESEQVEASFEGFLSCYKAHDKLNSEEEEKECRKGLGTNSMCQSGKCNSHIEFYDVNSPSLYLHTDGPILSGNELRALQQAGNNDHCKKLDSSARREEVQDKKWVKHHPLSPLGPKHHHMPAFGILSAQDSICPIKNLFEELLVEKPVTATIVHDDNEANDEFEDPFPHISPKRPTCVRSETKSWFLSRCKCSPSGSMRRPLIGSFEESLISGHLLGGKAIQVSLIS